MNDLIAADVGIRQLHARFADAVWRQDDAEFSGCFASDGLWKIAGMEIYEVSRLDQALQRVKIAE